MPDNAPSLPPELSLRLGDWLTKTIGLAMTDRNRTELLYKIAAAMPDFGFSDLETFVRWLVARSLTQAQIEMLASHLTIGETYFFRERQALEILEHTLLPALIDARRKTEKRLRLWSAGCSTGEEPYSLAILLDRLLPDQADWQLTLLATDINPVALRKAREGVYAEWSFRSAPPWLRERYFEPLGNGRYQLRREIRERVCFAGLNLSEDGYPALHNHTNAMDFIFCRNVLMYFAPAQIRTMVQRFHRTLQDKGWLIVSPVETALLADSPFTPIRFQDWTFYQKQRRLVGKAVEPPWGCAPSAPEPVAQTASSATAEIPPNPPLPKGGTEWLHPAQRARELANQGRLDEALEACQSAIAADKSNSGLYYLHATILEEQQRLEEAGASLKKALYLDHGFVLAHFALANLARRAGKTTEARKYLNNVQDILAGYPPDEVLPESEGLTAARLTQIIRTINLEDAA